MIYPGNLPTPPEHLPRITPADNAHEEPVTHDLCDDDYRNGAAERAIIDAAAHKENE